MKQIKYTALTDEVYYSPLDPSVLTFYSGQRDKTQTFLHDSAGGFVGDRAGGGQETPGGGVGGAGGGAGGTVCQVWSVCPLSTSQNIEPSQQ